MCVHVTACWHGLCVGDALAAGPQHAGRRHLSLSWACTQSTHREGSCCRSLSNLSAVLCVCVYVHAPAGTLFEGADLTETIWEDALIGERPAHL